MNATRQILTQERHLAASAFHDHGPFILREQCFVGERRCLA